MYSPTFSNPYNRIIHNKKHVIKVFEFTIFIKLTSVSHFINIFLIYEFQAKTVTRIINFKNTDNKIHKNIID